MGEAYGVRPSELLLGDPDAYRLDQVVFRISKSEFLREAENQANRK